MDEAAPPRSVPAERVPGPASAGEGASLHAAFAPLIAFADVAEEARYAPLPDDWVLGLADVVDSTRAIEAGRYKTVNMLGVAAITAVSNALPGIGFPFVFGGDGASVALPGGHVELLRGVLAATAAFARDELGLALRVALVPVSAARAAGFDVRVARVAPSPHVAYAMFAGGGLAWAEGELKAGRFAVPPAPVGTRPDLAGLSCRFAAIPTRRGVVLSLIAVPGPAPAGFSALVMRVLRLADEDGEEGRPLPAAGPYPAFRPEGLEVEARAAGRSILIRLRVAARAAAGAAILRLGRRMGRFDPKVYRRTLVLNADFRKYDDGLRMTIDCSERVAEAIEAALREAAAAGTCRFGLHRQVAAHLTCYTPSATRMDHIHFVDGAGGGYAAAAAALKRALRNGPVPVA